MISKPSLLAAITALLIAACEIENSLEPVNPYMTARIIVALERRGIEYRLAEDGVIHYPNAREDEVEAARQQAYNSRGKTSAVIARPAQARLIAEQFASANIDYSAKELEHFVLITWAYPRNRGAAADADGARTQ